MRKSNVMQIESGLLDDTSQISSLYLKKATWHRTTHLGVFASKFRGPSPTVNSGQNATEIGRSNVQNMTPLSNLISLAAPSYWVSWLGVNIKRLCTSHLSFCNRQKTFVMKFFIHHTNVGDVRHSAQQIRVITWRTVFQIKYCSEHYLFCLERTFDTDPWLIHLRMQNKTLLNLRKWDKGSISFHVMC
jgi:hypothetical protein